MDLMELQDIFNIKKTSELVALIAKKFNKFNNLYYFGKFYNKRYISKFLKRMSASEP